MVSAAFKHDDSFTFKPFGGNMCQLVGNLQCESEGNM